MAVTFEVDLFTSPLTNLYMRTVFGNRQNYARFLAIHDKLALELACRGLFV